MLHLQIQHHGVASETVHNAHYDLTLLSALTAMPKRSNSLSLSMVVNFLFENHLHNSKQTSGTFFNSTVSFGLSDQSVDGPTSTLRSSSFSIETLISSRRFFSAEYFLTLSTLSKVFFAVVFNIDFALAVKTVVH